MINYPFRQIEKKWQQKWQNENTFKTKDIPEKKFYVLEMFAYPSGNIHVGHVRNYVMGDIIARFKRQNGFDVLHPFGWDAFGLPAENAAKENNLHPKDWTMSNIKRMKKQLMMLGLSYDWDREITTCDESYYKVQQEFFIKLYENNLIERKTQTVNWDPKEQTVLANEQVIDGKGWRSGVKTEKKQMATWSLKISDFADDLLSSLSDLSGWPNKVKSMQTQWIGKSDGVKIKFKISNRNDLDDITVFTTCPETIFGASFIAISPFHKLATILKKDSKEIETFVNIQQKEQGEKTADIDKKEKIGLNTNLFADHPFDKNRKIPIFIANFVMTDYGSGAIFGCPYHDDRDFEFATKYNLDIKQVVFGKGKKDNAPYTGDGIMQNSDFLDHMPRSVAKKEIINRIETQKIGKRKTQYKLRDWGVSRQRYWGCPIPMIDCKNCGLIPDYNLPITLPYDVDITANGNPLSNHPTWKKTKCPKCNNDAIRETDTLDTFFDSSWYFLAYCSSGNLGSFSKDDLKKWMQVDEYIGGIEHAILHLLYARFITKALYKCKTLDFQEPFLNLLTQGMVCHNSYKTQDGNYLFPDDVILKDGKFYDIKTKQQVIEGRAEKMSKSKKNVIDPEKVIESYGVDAIRLFIVSDTPPEKDILWQDSAIEGCWRFINRMWQFFSNLQNKIKPEDPLATIDKSSSFYKSSNKFLKQITHMIEDKHFNRAIAIIREWFNMAEEHYKNNKMIPLEANYFAKTFAMVTEPIIPHFSNEIKSILCIDDKNKWPDYDTSVISDDTVKIACQVNGKLKKIIEIKKGATKDDAIKIAKTDSTLCGILSHSKKIIFVPDKILSIVC